VRALDRRNEIGPVFGNRLRPGATAPRAFEDRVQEKHRHVAANAVTLPGDVGNGFNRRPTQSWMEGIQLQYISPRREVWISATGKYVSVYLDEGIGIVLGADQPYRSARKASAEY